VPKSGCDGEAAKDVEAKGSINRPEICVSSGRASLERKTIPSIRTQNRGNPDSNCHALFLGSTCRNPPQKPSTACQFDVLLLLLAYSNVSGTLKKRCIPYRALCEPQVREVDTKNGE